MVGERLGVETNGKAEAGRQSAVRPSRQLLPCVQPPRACTPGTVKSISQAKAKASDRTRPSIDRSIKGEWGWGLLHFEHAGGGGGGMQSTWGRSREGRVAVCLPCVADCIHEPDT